MEERIVNTITMEARLTIVQYGEGDDYTAITSLGGVETASINFQAESDQKAIEEAEAYFGF